jgi:hypothetical protein
MPETPHRATGRNRLFEFSIGRPCCRIAGRDIPVRNTLRLGSAADVQRRRAPVGGENAEHLKMAACLIFNGLLKIIFKLSGENARTQGKRPFSDVHRHFHGDAGSPTVERSTKGVHRACAPALPG